MEPELILVVPLNCVGHFFALRVNGPEKIALTGVALLGLMLFRSSLCDAQEAQAPSISPAKKVLILFSEAKDLPGNTLMDRALRDEIQKHSTNRIDFFTENQDAGRFSDPSHLRLFKDYLGEKYARENLDLVVTFMARDFALADELPAAVFSHVPKVFVAVSELDIPEDLNQRGFRGIVQRFDIPGTIGLIFHLQPETRRVVVIGGTSAADRLTLGRIEEVAGSLEDVEFNFWTNQPLADLRVLVRSLDESTVILVSSVQRDGAGQPFHTSQIAQMLAPSSKAPMYVLGAGVVVGSGAVGGAVVDFDSLGSRAGRLAVQILEGAPGGESTIETRTTGTPMVDWRALKRWRIPEKRLPAGCVVRFRPRSLWGEHKWLIVSGLAVLLAQAITIAGLVAQRVWRRRAESEIQRQRTELAHVARVSTLGQLASSLAHELNQPLGAILRNAEAGEMLLQSEKPDLTELRAIVTDIRKDDQRAAMVIDRMRALLKRRGLESNLLNSREWVEDTIALARPDAAARKVNLRLELAPDLPEVRGDRVHLQQVLLNLLLNGMDAMDGLT
ncbi:MAG: hypothetical protein QOJ40_160, partial [Verrucomicrobiota bacterium]